MATCCARLSKLYTVTTNSLCACLGVAFIAFGLIGYEDKFHGATLFPQIYFTLIAVLGAIIIVAALVGMIAAFIKRRSLVIIYLVIVFVALVFQVIIGVKVYQKSGDPVQYLASLWGNASIQSRAELQNDFSCCGFNTVSDNPAPTDQCAAGSGAVMNPPCYAVLRQYVNSSFSKLYLVIFVALAIEVLCICNGITVLCTRSIYGRDDDEEERRRRRKSGIKLDDMSISPDTPTTAGSYNHFGDYYKEDANSTYGGKPPGSRYDSYDMYRQHHAYGRDGDDAYNDAYARGKYY
ncbi:Tetraspanin family-domain-containing protein [Radiomyces spectabilis]|uniref:Tetraspanin family-domain-containing protein n=1 Tax=Radiomyces spectabilis TaxID=64574 RepID=UPI00221F5F9F|nr:Tetraspanin family-domain-containing protein [Radiomyces spectabilis]KAI8374639.1 Tetraspanin family-domain-containing protein [Radiomyces spectabilis]